MSSALKKRERNQLQGEFLKIQLMRYCSSVTRVNQRYYDVHTYYPSSWRRKQYCEKLIARTSLTISLGNSPGILQKKFRAQLGTECDD